MGLLSSKRLSSLVLAGASTAAIAAALAPSAASAACVSTTTPITGQGATLQGVAQNDWIASTTACRGSIRYTGTGSGAGLRAFGADGVSTPTTDAYIGTDEAPTARQIAAMTTAAASPIEVIPVAQAAVSILVNLPASCTPAAGLTALWADGSAIRNAYESATAPTFSALFPSSQVTGTGCNTQVTPIARSASSGTTLIFKNYLVNNGGVSDATGDPVWGSANVRAVATSGGALVDVVKTTQGAIGYANLADADGRSVTGTPIPGSTSAGAFWVSLRNGAGLASTSSPQVITSGQERSNCSGTAYGANPGSTRNADWTRTVAGAPTGTATYPICGLTYDVAYSNVYSTLNARAGGISFTSDVGDTARQYLQYATSAAGQALLNRNNYAPLPTTGSPTILATAQAGSAAVN